jgi:hypothetical protein
LVLFSCLEKSGLFLCPFLRKEVSAAANRIMGITVEIGEYSTKLQTALKGVNGQIKSTQQQLKDVDKLLKLDPGNTELRAQKQKLLAEAVGETKEKLATLKTAAEQANTALANGDISQEQYDALQREIIETEQKCRNNSRCSLCRSCTFKYCNTTKVKCLRFHGIFKRQKSPDDIRPSSRIAEQMG